MRAGCHTADALDYLAKSFVQLMRVREPGDFRYVKNCLWWAEHNADKALEEIAAAGMET